jgi:hypothetical protein
MSNKFITDNLKNPITNNNDSTQLSNSLHKENKHQHLQIANNQNKFFKTILDKYHHIQLIFNKNTCEGCMFFNFNGINNTKIISGYKIINLGSFLNYDYMLNFFQDTNNIDMKHISKDKLYIDLCNIINNNPLLKKLKDIYNIYSYFPGCVLIFYIDISDFLNTISNYKNTTFLNNTNCIELIKYKMEYLISLINSLLQLNIFASYFINLEYGYHMKYNDGIHNFISTYFKANTLFINNHIDNYKYFIDLETPDLTTIKLGINAKCKFVSFEILQLYLKSAYVSPYFITLDNFNTYINCNYNLEMEHLQKNGDVINCGDLTYPKIIKKYLDTISDYKLEFTKQYIAGNINSEIKNNVSTTINTILKINNINNWLIVANTNATFDYNINAGISNLIEDLYNNSTQCDNNFSNVNGNDVNCNSVNGNVGNVNGVNMRYNNTNNNNRKRANSDGQFNDINMQLIGVSYEIISPLNIINNIMSSKYNNQNPNQNKFRITIPNTSSSTRIIKIYIHNKPSINNIVNIILRKLSFTNIDFNNKNIKNIIIVYYENATYNMTKSLKNIIIKKINKPLKFGSIFMNIHIQPYIRKCLAYMCYQDKFVKYGISNQVAGVLIKKRLELHDDYLKYCNRIINKFRVNEKYNNVNMNTNMTKNINKSTNKNVEGNKVTHCECCSCSSKNNNYNLEYKYTPYLLEEPINNLAKGDLSYWMIE